MLKKKQTNKTKKNIFIQEALEVKNNIISQIMVFFIEHPVLSTYLIGMFDFRLFSLVSPEVEFYQNGIKLSAAYKQQKLEASCRFLAPALNDLNSSDNNACEMGL